MEEKDEKILPFTNSESESKSQSSTELEKELNDDESFESITIDLPFEEEKKGNEKKDDELWDPTTELDDVSLFEEFADEIAEIEKAEKEKSVTKNLKTSDEFSNILDESQQEQNDLITENKNTYQQILPEKEEKSIIPLVISVLSALLLLLGLFTMWKLISIKPQQNLKTDNPIQNTQGNVIKTAKNEEKSQPHQADQITSKKDIEDKNQTDIQKNKENIPSVVNLPHFETISLSSFIIPATQNGQLVFLNIQISLLVQDTQMKKQFLMRETRIRDTIYRELKGVDISKGIDENTLLVFRKPLIDKINQEYSPLKVEDIKLSGYILK